jgi:hypothetical protein
LPRGPRASAERAAGARGLAVRRKVAAGLPVRLESERDLRYTGYSHRVPLCVRVDASRHRIHSTWARFDGPPLSSARECSRQQGC